MYYFTTYILVAYLPLQCVECYNLRIISLLVGYALDALTFLGSSRENTYRAT